MEICGSADAWKCASAALQPGRYWVVGHYIGDNALAAVGSSYTLMTFLTSIVIGLCLGSSAFLSMAYGKKNQDLIRNGIFISAVMIGSLAVILTGIIYIWMNPMIRLLQVPQETTAAMREYLFYVFIGFFCHFFYIIMLQTYCVESEIPSHRFFSLEFRDLKYFSGFILCAGSAHGD